MRIPILVSILPVFVLPLLAAAADDDDSTYKILHRVFGPGVPERPFSLRATLDPKSHQLTPASGYQDDLRQIYSDAREHTSALYQVAFHTPEPDLAGDRLSISSVKAVRFVSVSFFLVLPP